ncbi:MAG: hypothetical protein DWQ34_21030 [Planctomycetota bacterium]|nr:MAG: hypothetical protein DWQ34_21030 [Planctomycetota bacterium]REJ94075.1 MAG: hypothetical protein DWQ29_03260 [Planctomycetota bacterium]REK20621.1 MAG: hypothetical protein DWQ41_24465 [Planctomycetota bacterium]
MDDQLRGKIHGFVEQLLKEEHATFRKSQTLLEIENQAIEIGDEIARQLAAGDLANRSSQTSEQQLFCCPTCGRSCRVEQDLEPLILQGRRGEIEYAEPRCHCRSCRRDFFPDGERTSKAGS